MIRPVLAPTVPIHGEPVVRIYGPAGIEGRGATIAFNVFDPDGEVWDFRVVEERDFVMGLFAHLNRTFVAFGGIGQITSRVIGGEHADLRERSAAGIKRFCVGALPIDRTDQFISGCVERATRRQLVSDRVAATERLRAEAFVFESGLRFDAAKIAPHFLEATGHADPVFLPPARTAGGTREMIVSPESGRQRLDLKVSHVAAARACANL